MSKTIAFPLLAAVSLAAVPVLAGSPEPAPSEPAIQPAAPAPVAPASPNWTGFYAGGQLGYANVDTNVPGLDGDGFIGGLTAGYDYDLGNWVIGAGLDYDWTDIGLGGGNSLESVWRAKLRGGYKIGNGLLYGTGGYAEADVNTLGSDDGYFVGAGYEHAVMENFTVGGEVLYHEFDNFGGGGGPDVEATTVQLRGTFRF
ncbi:outer membrane beta-barrel protein [uncultured Roseovarius sp.]|uniref:outer membrane protein n=1 Tax=uncultured Roseovarius sp. TaxID=293344 RepID=UPI0025E97A4E|nr:outer membrane beta-barrel protein [uncultured Roseovarius sp.]